MKKIITVPQTTFDSLVGSSSSPSLDYICQAIAWFSTEGRTVIGIIHLDLIDKDFSSVVLGKDEVGAYRAIDCEISFEDKDKAISWLHNAMQWHCKDDSNIFPQGDTSKTIDLFSPVVPIAKQHPYFVRLSNAPTLFPAREMLKSIMPHFKDVDGNFIQQFQSTGFDARLWEIYLHAYFTEEKLFIDRSSGAIDFIVQKYGKTVAVEASTVGRKDDNPAKYLPDYERFAKPLHITDRDREAMAVRFGSALYSKLQKKYWELPQVSARPLVFAIADFHADQSMLWSSGTLIGYLYGVRHEHHYESGQLIIDSIKIKTHKVYEKEIQSGFFFLPEAENISAVLSSSIATIAKFNRKGRQAGFKGPVISMIRYGCCHDNDKNASAPKTYSYTVDESCTETWAEGLDMFHNPWARHPVPEYLFPTISHHRFESGQLISQLPAFYPYTSITSSLEK